MSYRTQILAAMKTALNGNTIAGSNVFTRLERPLDPARDTPAIICYTMGSRRGGEGYGDALIPRLVNVVIEAAVTAAPEAAQEMAEAFADEIETVIEADPTLGRVVNDCVWQSTLTDVTSAGSHVVGVVILEYLVDIFTNLAAPGFPDFHDDGFTAPPTLVTASPAPTPIDYARPLSDPSLPKPVPDDKAINDILNGDLTLSPATPAAPTESVCRDGSCDLPAWGGDQ